MLLTALAVKKGEGASSARGKAGSSKADSNKARLAATAALSATRGSDNKVLDMFVNQNKA